jgi:hypothetical protein
MDQSVKRKNGRKPLGKLSKPDASTRARRTPSWEEVFLLTLRQQPNVTFACEAADVARQTVYARKDSNEEFAKRMNDAIEEGADRLEQEAWRRAHDGILKPVYQGGMLVGHINEYSDTLMILLLKGHKPRKFRENQSVEMSGPDGQAIEPVQIYIPSNGRGK